MSMVKRGIAHMSIVECSAGDDMVRCPHCEKFISLKSTQNNGNVCKYCSNPFAENESSIEESKTDEVAV